MFQDDRHVVFDLKADLRNKSLRRRDGVDPGVRHAFALRLAEVGVRLVRDFVTPARSMTSLYAPIGSEPDIVPLATALHALSVPLALPVDWSHGSPLVYRRWVPGDRLAAGPLGICEPLEKADEVEPSVLFVPLAAFDRRGHRIGYGAGNVDRTLRSLRRRNSVCVIGVGFAVQEEAVVPDEPHDEALDLVVTEHDVIVCRR